MREIQALRYRLPLDWGRSSGCCGCCRDQVHPCSLSVQFKQASEVIVAVASGVQSGRRRQRHLKHRPCVVDEGGPELLRLYRQAEAG